MLTCFFPEIMEHCILDKTQRDYLAFVVVTVHDLFRDLSSRERQRLFWQEVADTFNTFYDTNYFPNQLAQQYYRHILIPRKRLFPK